MDLTPKGSSLQFTKPTKYKSRCQHRQLDTFQDYINNLLEWERQLFLFWKHITDHEELKTQRLLGKALYYVTDGGADNGIGYSGWVIATDTRIITKGYGQTQGNEHQMESLRAETYRGIA
eukprot:8167242-Ditylum_brightwellii.AAC.1